MRTQPVDVVLLLNVHKFLRGSDRVNRHVVIAAVSEHDEPSVNLAEKKVERQVSKSAAALLLESRIGEQFDSMVTGAATKGTWVRLLTLPVEGRVVSGFEGLDVGDRTRVQLISVNVQRGFIDFRKINSSKH